MKRSVRKQIPRRDLTTYGRPRAVRLPDCGYAGDERIHVTVCADDGVPFRDAAMARHVCDNVEHYSTKLRYRLFGYCLMPDHLHVLLSPENSGNALRVWLHDFKSYTTNLWMKQTQLPHLWQESGYDHVCRSEETAERVLTYIVNNPVRAGLVERWQDWPWTKVFIEL